jgi:phospholipid/cholesterol/gamma-HCH transport system substrate-binding protein
MKLKRETRIGIIAIVIITCAIWGYHFLKGKNIFAITNEYYLSYNNVEGISESGLVYYNGYQVGNINEVIFDANSPTNFTVKLILKKDFKIPIGTTAIAKDKSLIDAAKNIHLFFSDTNVFHQPGDTLLSGYDKGLLAILEPLQNQITEVANNVNTLINKEMQDDLHASIKALKNSLQAFSNSMSSNGNLGKSLSNLESITKTLDNKNEAIAQSLDNFASITTAIDSANLGQTILKLDSTLSSTMQIMTKINNSEGSAGLMVNDSSLYVNLTTATASLDSLLVDLKENPKRYVHVSVFGGKNK